MSCPSENLPLLATGRLTGLALWRTERHVKSCPTCQQELHELRALSDSLRALIQAEPSATLEERMLSIRPGAVEKSRQHSQNSSSGGSFLRHPLFLCPLIGAIGTTLFALTRPDIYTASGSLQIVSRDRNATQAPTLVELMKSSNIQKQVAREIGEPLPEFTIEVVRSTPIIRVTARGEDAEHVYKGIDRLMETTRTYVMEQQKIAELTRRVADFDGDIRIINEATTPLSPSMSIKALIMGGGLGLGIFLGALLTLFRRQPD